MNIIGNGDIAKALKEVKRPDLLFFASGVSNSGETRDSEYERERHLLEQQGISQHIVYFSSLSIFYSDTKYALHKRLMEANIKSWFRHYTIIRLGNITWGTNPHTIINYFRHCIKNNIKFEIKDEYRYIVNKDEFLYWINMIPQWNCEMNIVGRRLKVQEIVEQYGYSGGYNKK